MCSVALVLSPVVHSSPARILLASFPGIFKTFPFPLDQWLKHLPVDPRLESQSIFLYPLGDQPLEDRAWRITLSHSPFSRYLTREKRRGRALDPVAHFHFANGASVWRVNWMGDVSPTGLQRSYGLMANYRYHLPDMDSNSTAYTVDGRVTLSESVERLVV